MLGKAVNGVLTLDDPFAAHLRLRGDRAGRTRIARSSSRSRASRAGSRAAESKDVEETPTRFRHKVAAAKGQTTKANARARARR